VVAWFSGQTSCLLYRELHPCRRRCRAVSGDETAPYGPITASAGRAPVVEPRRKRAKNRTALETSTDECHQPAVTALDEVAARLPRIYSQIENNVSTEM